MNAILAALGETAIAQGLRQSFWTYPLVNAAHILGIGLLVGAIAPLDLRMLGLWRSVPAGPVARLLVPVAGFGLALAVATGVLLFLVRPLEYAALDFFLIKLALIAAASGNILLLRLNPAWKAWKEGAPETAPASLHVRLAGVASLGLWIAALVFGRLVGYRL